MKQTRTFFAPVLKSDNSGNPIAVGDLATLVLRDKSTTMVVVVSVEKGGRKISWDLADRPTIPSPTSSQNATAAASDDTTGDALANALKASYNAAQVDIASLFGAYSAAVGAPTSSQNSTTAASNDATRMALANALKVSYNAAQVDIAELYAHSAAITVPTSSQNATAAASNDATTQALLNALKVSYNDLQADIANAFTKLDNGYFIPLEDDVIGVSADHQKAVSVANLHDGDDYGAIDPVVNNE